MKKISSEKLKRNQQIRKLLAEGRVQAEIAREFNITPQRLNQLVQKWGWQGLLERTEDGFAIPEKGQPKPVSGTVAKPSKLSSQKDFLCMVSWHRR